MPMDEVARRDFHKRLDAILDRRSKLETPLSSTPGTLGSLLGSGPIGRHDARPLLLEIVALARDVLGDGIRAGALERLYQKDSEQRKLLQSWLLDLWPLIHANSSTTILGIAPKRELTIFEVMDAVSALDAGEIRPLFVANKGKNRRANRWSVARAKLEALVWKERLRALGYAEKAANLEVTMAFGEQWDTVRKWKKQCEQIMGAQEVRMSLEFAGSPQDVYIRKPRGGMLGTIKPDPMKSLQAAGANYRNEIRRSAELSKRKSRAAA
jgi:hypothetical protein